MEHFAEDALSRHDAVAHLVVDGAAGMAFLADLGELEHHVARAESRANRQALQVEALDDDVLAEPLDTSAPRALKSSIVS